MRRLIKLLLVILLMSTSHIPAFSAINGRLEYQVPIDYSKLSQEELETKADFYYKLTESSPVGKVDEDITAALNLYTILQRKCPENYFYNVRLGTLYAKIGKDRYAKGCFYAALGTNSELPEPYFRLGEFYYRRELYRKALNNYKLAYKYGYQRHFETLYKIGDIYAKLGDSEAAIKYLNLALEINPTDELGVKINKLDASHGLNREYYSNTRIHFIER